MATRFYFVSVAVPAGTPQTAPVVQPVLLEDNQLDQVQVIIPDGHDGTTGLQVQWNGTTIVPYNTGAYLVGNNEEPVFPYGSEVTESGLQIAAFNTDVYEHSFFLRFQISDLTATPAVPFISPQAQGAPPPATVAAVVSLAGTVPAAGLSPAGPGIITVPEPVAPVLS